ncbi:hypothetical protein PQX77_002437 [Marasmius sp. AFHP31]|nr:hypothetical protein PQX77_002437 [Marasmius sp. AFHP31]
MSGIANNLPTLVNFSEKTALEPYQAIDGKVGAWIEDGKYFVTSPNSTELYQPLFGSREIYMRQNYRFGAEDPIQYPQPFIPDRCHWAAIPRRPSSSAHSRARWWDSLPPEAFVHEPDSAIKGIGRWSQTYITPYQEDCSRLHERVQKYRSGQEYAGGDNRLIPALNGQLERTLRHLLTMPLPLHRARQLWSFFQRWYLELVGALDWMELYLPVMNGSASPSETSRVHAAVATGAFLTSVKDCEFFFRAGIPFWLIRSAEHHSTVRVDEEVVPLTPCALKICLDDIMSHEKEVLYHGSLHALEKATAVEKFGLAIVDYTNDPFSVPVTELSAPSHPSSAPPHSSSTGPSRPKIKRQRHEPYNKGKSKAQNVHHAERDKFVEIRGPCSPPVPEVWVNALSSIDRSRRPAKAQVINGGYSFPDPGMILYPPQEKRERLLRNWLRFRPVLTYRHCMPASVASGAWSSKQWRVILGTTEDYVVKDGSHKMAEQRAAVQELLGQCLKFYRLEIDPNPQDTNHFTWQGHRLPIGRLSDPRVVQEIVWELFELNFRFELHALNNKMRPADIPFSPEVQDCFSGLSGIGNPTQIDFRRANSGLAAASIRHRGKYFHRLCLVMKDWAGGAKAESFVAGKEKWEEHSDAELEIMEQWATKFYCQTFFEHFGRPPILPHRLD